MRTYVLKVPNGAYGSVHKYHGNGHPLCGDGACVLQDYLEVDTGLKISCQKCKELDMKKKTTSLVSPLRIVSRASKAGHPFTLDPAIKWIARDGDGDWIGFTEKPCLVRYDGFWHWIDTVGEYIYPLGESEYKRNSDILETLEEIK
jgi:hypothetical protein